jgi:hypothetical protein
MLPMRVLLLMMIVRLIILHISFPFLALQITPPTTGSSTANRIIQIIPLKLIVIELFLPRLRRREVRIVDISIPTLRSIRSSIGIRIAIPTTSSTFLTTLLALSSLRFGLFQQSPLLGLALTVLSILDLVLPNQRPWFLAEDGFVFAEFADPERVFRRTVVVVRVLLLQFALAGGEAEFLGGCATARFGGLGCGLLSLGVRVGGLRWEWRCWVGGCWDHISGLLER